MEQVRVRVHDQEYLLLSEEGKDQAHRIADYLNRKLEEIERQSEGLSEKKTIILAALNIAGDYLHAVSERDELSAEIRQRTEALIYHIDSAMGRSSTQDSLK